MNDCLDYKPACFKRIGLFVRYRRKSFPPASYLFLDRIKKDFPSLSERIRTGSQGKIDWILIHGDLHFSCAEFLGNKLGAGIVFGSRCNDIARARIIRDFGDMGLGDRLLSYAYEGINRNRERRIARKARLIAFQNRADRDEFMARTSCRRDKTAIIPGNIGLPRFAEEWKDRNDSDRVRHLVYVGALSKSKGLPCLLDALAILKAKGYPTIRLSVLAHVSDPQSAEELVSSRGISDMVTFEGYTLPFPFLATCDLMVYPSLYDAFPDAILEALHTGCPVIASRVGGIPEMLERDELLFDNGDAEAIARIVMRCVDDPEFYRSLRKSCADRATRYRFDWAAEWERAMKC